MPSHSGQVRCTTDREALGDSHHKSVLIHLDRNLDNSQWLQSQQYPLQRQGCFPIYRGGVRFDENATPPGEPRGSSPAPVSGPFCSPLNSCARSKSPTWGGLLTAYYSATVAACSVATRHHPHARWRRGLQLLRSFSLASCNCLQGHAAQAGISRGTCRTRTSQVTKKTPCHQQPGIGTVQSPSFLLKLQQFAARSPVPGAFEAFVQVSIILRGDISLPAEGTDVAARPTTDVLDATSREAKKLKMPRETLLSRSGERHQAPRRQTLSIFSTSHQRTLTLPISHLTALPCPGCPGKVVTDHTLGPCARHLSCSRPIRGARPARKQESTAEVRAPEKAECLKRMGIVAALARRACGSRSHRRLRLGAIRRVFSSPFPEHTLADGLPGGRHHQPTGDRLQRPHGLSLMVSGQSADL